MRCLLLKISSLTTSHVHDKEPKKTCSLGPVPNSLIVFRRIKSDETCRIACDSASRSHEQTSHETFAIFPKCRAGTHRVPSEKANLETGGAVNL